VPDTLPEVTALSHDPDPNAPSTLATTLWIKYRSSFDWGWKTWDNAVAAIQQIARDRLDAETRNICALRYCNFLWKVDQHLPNGLDNDVLQWLLAQGKARLGGLDDETWEVLRTVLVFLVIHGSIKTTTVLQGLIYPTWHEGATALPGQQSIHQTCLSAVNKLSSCLLLQDDNTKEQSSPMDLFETQCIRTMRQAVYEEPHFPLLVESIPTLIAIENNDNIPTPQRSEASILREHICQESGFRQGAYRNLDIIRNTFENSPYLIDENPASDNLIKSALAGLQMILSDSTGGMSMTDLFETRHLTKEIEDTNICDWKEVTSLLSPWKIAATTIQMQIQVKKLGRALSHQSTSASAIADLNKLTSTLFRHTRTAEEAYYVGEMARGSDSAVASKVTSFLPCFFC
jgi:mediator of RNA polymerase II transcription subunit 12